MSYQFCCPQGHVLQGDLSTVGQLFQCPMCGASFLVPPPDGGAPMAGGFMPGPGAWPAGNAVTGMFPQPGMMPTMPLPQGMQGMPGGPLPMVPMPGGQFSPQGFPPQPFGLAAPGVMPMAPAAASTSAPAPAQPQASAASTGTEERSPFDLGFDPAAKASLPFEMPGEGGSEAAGAEAEPATPQSPAAFSPGPFAAAPLSAPTFSPAPADTGGFLSGPATGPTMPAPSQAPATRTRVPRRDFLASAPAVQEEPAATSAPPKVLHIRCPSGHMVKASSDLLGKNGRCPACKKTFELRYEDSVEFQRRTQKLLHREEVKTGRAWIAWTLLGAFLVFAALVGLMLLLGR